MALLSIPLALASAALILLLRLVIRAVLGLLVVCRTRHRMLNDSAWNARVERGQNLRYNAAAKVTEYITLFYFFTDFPA